MNPWVGVALITIGIAATITLAVLRLPDDAAVASIIAVGLAVVQGVSHSASRRENAMLKCQLRANNPDQVHR